MELNQKEMKVGQNFYAISIRTKNHVANYYYSIDGGSIE